MRLIDTNILVHAADANSSKQQRARDVLTYYIGMGQAYVALQSVVELYSALTKTTDQKTAKDSANMVLKSKGFKKITYDSVAVAEALELAESKGFRRSEVFDALLVATAKNSGIDTILTENPKHFEGMGLNVETLDTASV